MPITARQYEDDDTPDVLAFLRQSYRLQGPPVYATAGELDWWRCIDPTLEGMGRARLWLDGDQIVGLAYPAYGRVDLLVHPEYGILNEPMLAWAEGDRLRQAGRLAALGTWSFTADHARLNALKQRGYRQGDAYFSYRQRPLADALPDAPLPPGYRLRSITGEADFAARAAVHNAAFASTTLSASRYRRVMASAAYRADLDLVAVAPEGEFAAFCIVWYDAENGVGAFEPVGTHPAHQRRGLARAVMVEGLRRLQALGAHIALVNAYHEDTPALRLYESLGFTEADRCYAWEK